jgi:metal-responsive CopG/Arc/MetJ family transcriptional regulator
MDEELLERLDSNLTYGDTRSEYVRNAIRLRLDVEEIFEEQGIELTPEKERELVVEAVEKAIEERDL